MPSAADDVRRAIDADGGAIRFDEFVNLALYGDRGFYTRSDHPGHAGRRGDFITSPEVGPLFGTVMARALDSWWHELGRPDHGWHPKEEVNAAREEQCRDRGGEADGRPLDDQRPAQR